MPFQAQNISVQTSEALTFAASADIGVYLRKKSLQSFAKSAAEEKLCTIDSSCSSDIIGAYYTPTAVKLKVKELNRNHKNGRKACTARKTGKKINKSDPHKEKAAGYMTLEELLTQAHVPEHLKRKNEFVGPDPAAQPKLKRPKTELASPDLRKFDELTSEEYHMFCHGQGRLYSSMDPTQPIDPDEQMKIIKKIKQDFLTPSAKDLQNYEKYIAKMPDEQVLPWPADLTALLLKKVPKRLTTNPKFHHLLKSLIATAKSNFGNGLKHAVMDYLLLSPDERKAMGFSCQIPKFERIVIRAPISWHHAYLVHRESIRHYMFCGHPVLIGIRKIWDSSYGNTRTVSMKELKESKFPLTPSDLVGRVRSLASDGRSVMTKLWVPEVANLYADLKSTWVRMVPTKKSGSLEELRKFFASACSLMSIQMRTNAELTLKEMTEFFQGYKDGNDYGEDTPYHESLFLRVPIMTVTLDAKTRPPCVTFNPSVTTSWKRGQDCKGVMIRFLSEIIAACSKVPRVERILFPDLSSDDLFLLEMNVQEERVQNYFQKVIAVVRANMRGPVIYAKMYNKYLWLLDGTAEKDLREFLSRNQNFKALTDHVESYKETLFEISKLDRQISLNLVSLDCSVLNEELIHRLEKLIATIVDGEVRKNKDLNALICKSFEEMSQRISVRVETTNELVALQTYIHISIADTFYRLKSNISESMQRLLFLLEYHIFEESELELHSTVFHWPTQMSDTFEQNLRRLQLKREQVEEQLEKEKADFETNLLQYIDKLEAYKTMDSPYLDMDEMAINAKALTDLNSKIQECVQTSKRLNEEERLLDQKESPFDNLQLCLQLIEPFYKLWTTAHEFHLKYFIWFDGPFLGLDAEAIVDEVESMLKLMYKLAKIFSELPSPKRVADTVRAKIERFRQHLPLLLTICNPGLRDRHWELMSEICGLELNPTPETTLADMIETGIGKQGSQLEEISAAATKEFYLEKNLKKMFGEWTDIKFECIAYRETGVTILSALDDIQSLLDDQILKAQTMKGSPFIKPLEAEMKLWEDKLVTMQNILDAWVQVQSTWLYLEPIFSSPDIIKQMPSESKKFNNVDKLWRNIMKHTTSHPDVLAATEYPNMLRDLNRAILLLEEIQVGLGEYLEKKRHFFPRFFFLSNDELLEILSETKDPLRVQPHLKKCFEGIHHLNFTPDTRITGMVSAEGEEVPFSKQVFPLEARGMVEKWLAQVEQQMLASLRDVTLKAVEEYSKIPKTKWVLNWPGQVVICGDSIFWTKDVSDAIQSGTLKNYLRQSNKYIDEIVGLVRGKLDHGARVTLGALIVIAVHARDVVFALTDMKVRSITDFNWISQLRYYLEGYSVCLRMITTETLYGFEYLGNSSRLVITPLTDRCYRTLMSAIKLNLGGAPEGPAGTGKTETCKDLAKAVAKQCVVFNCSDGLDYKAMGKFFKGLAQSGSWCVFDEFNRIIVEVLSVVAQQILTIQNAIAAKVKTFIFENTELRLVPTCNIFITMNPGYAGRQELPDNLKVLFRTVAMMVPDYALIGEISLYSMGFVDARSLAGKIVDTYKLCSEQLSSQHHYDYGMRAVKSVLSAAGSLKLKFPSENEGVLVLKAINDVNMPKFLAQDMPLFQGIISDLFPGLDLLRPDLQILTDTIKTICGRKNLQATDFFVEKVLQIYEMILVRHGLMIVGEAMGAKTCAYQCLAAALTEINMTASNGPFKEERTYYRVINPKSITMGQLYGCFDPVSHEWSDGVLANAFRAMASSENNDRKWIVFDGPVDAIWVENMNTVLDDNRKLCLMSGEIIQMTPQMNMLFEPGDLEQASPATVSRCGMIYMEPRQLGWRPLKDSYLEQMPDSVAGEQKDLIIELLDWLMQPCFEFIRHNCKRFIYTSELHLFQSFARIYGSMLRGFKGTDDQGAQSTVWIQSCLIFSIIWGLGSTLTTDSRIKFDTFYRHLVIGNNKEYPRPKNLKITKNQLFSDKGLCFDYVCDRKNNQWIPWLNSIDREQGFSSHAKVYDLIVPTDETARQTYFLKLCTCNGVPLMFVGPTGTGKSAITLHYLMSSAPRDRFVANVINFSARTTAAQTQDIVMAKLDRRKKGLFGPQVGKKCVIFIDDLSMPQKECYGAQPPIELLRQWIDHSYWFDKKDTTTLQLVDCLLVAAMAEPGGGRNEVTSRFIRHLNIMAIDSFDDITMKKIFGAVVDWHFGKDFDPEVVRWTRPVVQATLNVYKASTINFLPTPAKSHYVFNLRDFSKVIRGLLMTLPAFLPDAHKLMRLWVHEVYRVFCDRLVDDEDRHKFFDIVSEAVEGTFKLKMDKLLEHLRGEDEQLSEGHMHGLMFGDFIDPHTDVRIYDEISDFDELSHVMETYSSDFNTISKTPMHLVLFKFALEHISRISRVLKQPSGHALLIGIGGSGRQSLTKMATFMAGYDLITVEISRTYGIPEWREDLKKILKHSGNEGKQTTFLFADNQVKDESFVEDINMVLNTGEVPNIFNAEEKAEILERMQNSAKESGELKDSSPLTLYGIFIDRVRANLHIVFAMSPVGEAFRSRLRMFPSLINCCTIDWFTEWPQDALERVAKKYLSGLEMEQEMLDGCVFMCKQFHESVRLMSIKFAEQLHRNNYVTPTSYLELILTFKTLLAVKRTETEEQRQRYITGLEKLHFAASQVSIMQDELTALQPVLIETSAATEKLMIKIERDTVDVEATKEVVAADEALANEAAAAAQAIKDDCENDLAEAIPALEAAIQALDTLKPADITVIKSMKNPPAPIKMVLEAICIMRGIKSDRKLDQNGRAYEDFWGPSMKMLGDLKFLEALKEYDKDNISPPIMKRIREKFTKNPDFDPAVIRNVSTACEGLCKWVRAMEVYDRVIRIVEPKKAKLNEAEGELQAQMDKLNEKRAQLQRVTDKLQALNDEYAAMNKKKRDLEENIALCSEKLARAEKLIDGLSGEKTRWSEGATQLTDKLANMLGDVLISAAVVAYLGPFTVDYRQNVLTSWKKLCIDKKIPCSEEFSFIATLGDPVKIRNWVLAGLPIDSFSIDNAIIVHNSRRWPLMIDPQGQANKWVRNMEKDNKLAVTKLSDSGYLRHIENALQLGLPVLIDNLGEELDPALEPVLLKQTFKQGVMVFIRIGENVVEYNDDFRLYMISRLRNPHYMPELAVKVTLLNFMITPTGLEDQLLGIVAAKEKPVLEEQKNRLVVEGVANKNLLKEIEDKILKVLSSSKGNILEDETAIQILSSSKELSTDILRKQTVAAVTEKKIDGTRNLYRPVAVHASTLFFCISELASIDPMYQYSLNWFLSLYTTSISSSRQSKDLGLRILYLRSYFTSAVYRNVCRSVFERDKLVFSFVLCVALLRSQGDFPLDVWAFLLTEGVAFENPYPNPARDWLPEKSWGAIVRLSGISGFEALRNHVQENCSGWKALYDAKKPHEETLPSPWNEIGELERLAILRCIRNDKLLPAVQAFVVNNLGKEFIEPPPFDLASSYRDSSYYTPLIFILSPGSDPMTELQKFAKERGFTGAMMVTVSLGQGQGPIAENMIEEAAFEGGWVVLQNCHLATSWMPSLEMICQDKITSVKTHPDFRLWLTSYPSPEFPIAVLQNGIKITNEAPQGLRANLMRNYLSSPIADPEFYDSVKEENGYKWQRMIFGLCFFHALVQERRKYGPLGWNIPYEFNDSDLKISLLQLQMFLQDCKIIPLDALTYLTGECNYGGRVTDDKDRRLLLSLLSKFYSKDILKRRQMELSPSGKYAIPESVDYGTCVEYIKKFPLNPNPEIFGLHENASISKGNQETMDLLNRALRTQTALESSSKKGSKPTAQIIEVAQSILNKLPEEFDIETIEKSYPVDYMNSMNTVLRQELIRFNRLNHAVRETLKNAQKAIQGQIVMTPELDEVVNSIIIGKIPQPWAVKSYPSLKPLGSYVSDLLARLQFFQTWIDQGTPDVFWLSGFYFTQSFLTGVLQNYARQHHVAIDQLGFEFEVSDIETEAEISSEQAALKDDVMIQGLFLEGTAWDRQGKKLTEPKPKILYDTLPIMFFKPGARAKFEPELVYDAPVYKTSARQGTLSTTGHSTNFVLYLQLPTQLPQQHWINRGAACLCQLDD